ncbi:DUF1007 family protein [uncultured Cohaesibacter sp.]|uniref:DUF1007 family protein n=1 Tax=uncultured Cohaesibacter sp. TaxID=1002546 RepID=UPI00292CC3C6|nr:DUF1007 family protein [uncultured Cohaesibacter sp.]
MRLNLLSLVTFVVGCCLPFSLAQAHPHVWVSVKTELVMTGDKVTAVNHSWTFDEAFSAFASQGLDEDDDGVLSREELQPLAEVNVESLAEFGYFSDIYEQGAPDTTDAVFGDPRDYWLSSENGFLILHFTLPVLSDVDARQEAVLDVYDPTYFVDFSFPEKDPVSVRNSGQSCDVRLIKPAELDAETASLLATVPQGQREPPGYLMKITSTLANQVILKCE